MLALETIQTACMHDRIATRMNARRDMQRHMHGDGGVGVNGPADFTLPIAIGKIGKMHARESMAKDAYKFTQRAARVKLKLTRMPLPPCSHIHRW